MSDRTEMEAAIEAVLFVSSEPVPRPRLLELFEEDEREQAEAALAAVLARYGGDTEARGVMVEDVAGGVRLVTRPEMGTWLRRFFDVASSGKLSMAALETLAIIAYRQPITGPEIQELRTVSPAGVLKTLLEKRLVRIAGRKEVVGKPFLYATTREFLVHFGLNSLRDLPPLEEFEETFGAGAGGAAGVLAAAEGGGWGAGAMSGAGRTGAVVELGGGAANDVDDGEDREERILREAAEAEARAAESEDRQAEAEDRETAAEVRRPGGEEDEPGAGERSARVAAEESDEAREVDAQDSAAGLRDGEARAGHLPAEAGTADAGGDTAEAEASEAAGEAGEPVDEEGEPAGREGESLDEEREAATAGVGSSQGRARAGGKAREPGEL